MFIRIFCLPFRINRTQCENNISELTTATGLFLQCLTMLNSSIKCFFIGYLRRSLVYFYLKLSLHTVHDDLEVQFTHT